MDEVNIDPRKMWVPLSLVLTVLMGGGAGIWKLAYAVRDQTDAVNRTQADVTHIAAEVTSLVNDLRSNYVTKTSLNEINLRNAILNPNVEWTDAKAPDKSLNVPRRTSNVATASDSHQ